MPRCEECLKFYLLHGRYVKQYEQHLPYKMKKELRKNKCNMKSTDMKINKMFFNKTFWK